MSGGLRTADYGFDLPPERIAQHPSAQRDACRMLVVDRASGGITHSTFRDLATIVPAGDTIVLNTSRVIKARLLGTREGGEPAELLLLAPLADGRWEAMVHPGGKLKPGRRVRIAPEVVVEIDAITPMRTRYVRFDTALDVGEVLERYGHVPLPPYIGRPDTPADAEQYQTVYARAPGSIAAPTAGLHFTPELLETLRARGVHRADVTLHVGAGTFKPVDSDDPATHVMHREPFTLDADAALTLNTTRDAGANIWAIGTTSLRVLESVVDQQGRFAEHDGNTDIFIRPPHVVRGADRLVTNFHLPRSTLLMLVAAFAGYDLMRHAYDVAVAEGYRFYSYGDAMCVI